MSRTGKGKGKRTDKVKILFILMIAVMSVLTAVTLVTYICSFLPVKKISVYGMTYYQQGEVIGHSGVKRGDKLYSISEKRTEERILENCAYIRDVQVKRVFPNKLVIVVDEKLPEWYVELSGNRYVLDESLMVIEETVANDVYVLEGIPRLVLPNVRSLMVGEQPQFGDGEQELKRSLELIYKIGNSTLKPRMTLVDIESRFNINIEVDGKYSVYMGDESHMEEKLLVIGEILKSDALKGCVGAEIDASVPETPHVKPIYSNE